MLPALIAILAHAGDAARYDEFLRALPARPRRRRRSSAISTRWPRSAQPALVEQTLARTINGEIRTQDAPFVARSMLMAVHAREPAWAFVKAHWDTMDRLLSQARPAADGGGRDRARHAGAGARRPRASSTSRKIDLGGKTLEQYLEQLRVAVALREREGPALSAYLARF